MARSRALLVSHYASIVSYANKAVTLNHDERATSIPFGRSRQDVNRKCSEQHPKQALTRENRIAKRNLAPARVGSGGKVRFSDYFLLLRCFGVSRESLRLRVRWLFRIFLHWRGGGSVWPDSALSFSLVRGVRKSPFSFLPALARRRFRLASQCVAFSSVFGVRKSVLFSVEEGGQTEWRWVGRGSLVGRGIRECTPLGLRANG